MQRLTAKRRSQTGPQGFTLIELMMTTVVCALVAGALVAVFTAHSRHYVEHDEVAELQQNLRGVFAIMPAEFRMAGCDPMEKKITEILEATSTEFMFTADTKSDSGSEHPNADDGKIGSGEYIGYRFNKETNTLYRSMGDANAPNYQPLADNIAALEFHYVLENGDTTDKPQAGEYDRIRAVQISILAYTTDEGALKGLSEEGRSYTPASGKTWKISAAPGDGVVSTFTNRRHRMMTTTVQLRNMELRLKEM